SEPEATEGGMFADPLTKGATVLVLALGVVLGAGASTLGQAAKAPAQIKTKIAAKARLDLNKASAQELAENLPAVGEATAKKIVAGPPYARAAARAKAGVPRRTINAIRNRVTAGPAAPASAAKATAKAKDTAGEAGPTATTLQERLQ